MPEPDTTPRADRSPEDPAQEGCRSPVRSPHPARPSSKPASRPRSEERHAELLRLNAGLAGANARSAELLAELEEKNRTLQEANLHLSRANAHAAELMAEIEVRNGEIRCLNLALSCANARGAELVAELEQRSSELEGEVRARRQTEEALRQAKREADAANRAKGLFLANMSHEIRTPMNAISGMASLLLDSPLTPEQREFASTLRSSAEALLDIINDILDFSKIDAGRVDLEVIDFKLRTCIEEVGDLLGPRAHEKGLELALLVQADVPEDVRGDPGRLRQILINLVGNAVKFTERGEVLVRVRLAAREGARLTVGFEVTDTGVGIPAGRVHALFQPFSQADSSTSRRYGGTGLGLAISRQLVEAMGGMIEVRSREGAGSAFSFTVALEEQPQAAEQAEPVRPADARGKKILVAEPSTANQLVFREGLRPLGCELHTAENATEALAILREAARAGAPFHAAVLDRRLPDMDPDALARLVRAEADLAGVRLILTTSAPRRGDALRARAAGFDAYLTKPVKRAQLIGAVRAVLGRRDLGAVSPPRPLITSHSLREVAPQGYRVLLAEDNVVNQKVAVLLLKKAGYRCDVVANGQEALEALGRAPYDLVLMDCQMPVMDGYEAAARIRATEVPGQRLPIIAMTAHAMKGDRERSLAAGMDDHVNKPVNAEALYEVLQRHLKERRPRASARRPSLQEAS